MNEAKDFPSWSSSSVERDNINQSLKNTAERKESHEQIATSDEIPASERSHPARGVGVLREGGIETALQ